MKKVSISLFAILVLMLIVASVALAGPVEAKGDKVDVCHVDGKGRTHPISVSPSALPAHLAHGDYTFVGDWDHGTQPYYQDEWTITREGNLLSGTWNYQPNGDFEGTLVNGCVVDMVFGANTYRGTLVSEGTIQWSEPNELDTVDPLNFWISYTPPIGCGALDFEADVHIESPGEQIQC